MKIRSAIQIGAFRCLGAAGALAIVAASSSMAQSTTFASYGESDSSVNQWSLSEQTVGPVTTTTLGVSNGATVFTFASSLGLSFGAQNATFNMTATTTQIGVCQSNPTCSSGAAYDQPGYSGTFSFIDTSAGAEFGTNLLSGTFNVTENPGATGGSLGATVGQHGGNFGAATDSVNDFQVAFTSAYLNFAGETSESSEFSLTSLNALIGGVAPFAATTTSNGTAYPSGAYTASGDGTFSSAALPAATPEPATFALIGGGLICLGILRRRKLRVS